MNTVNEWESFRWHAGLLYNSEPSDVADQVALSEAIWRVKRGEQTRLKASVEHVLLEFQKANLILNGPVPSESTDQRGDIPSQLAYAVSNLITQCAELNASNQASDRRQWTSGLTWVLSCAWDAVLAGDIDDVIAHVEMEAEARGIVAFRNLQDEFD